MSETCVTLEIFIEEPINLAWALDSNALGLQFEQLEGVNGIQIEKEGEKVIFDLDPSDIDHNSLLNYEPERHRKLIFSLEHNFYIIDD